MLTPSTSKTYDPSYFGEKGGLCMLGGIYTSQRCPACGGKFEDDGKRGFSCPSHPQMGASRYFVRFKGEIFRRFNNYDAAQRSLTGLRYKYDEGPFDARDYHKDNPLGFENLALQWLEVKRGEVKRSSYLKRESHGQGNFSLVADEYQAN